MPLKPLPAESLSVQLSPDHLPFRTTDELPCRQGFMGHARATEAIEFAIAMAGSGYNLFVLGETGTGRVSLLQYVLETAARDQPPPPDWLYLNHFEEVREPVPLHVPAGTGPLLVADMEALVDGLLSSVWTAFENPAYLRRKTNLERLFKERYDAALDRVAERAKAVAIVMFRNGETVSFAPLKDGAPVDEAGFTALGDAERDRFHKDVRMLEDCLSEALLELPQWKRETDDQLRLLAGELVEQAIAPLLSALGEKYAGFPGVMVYLETLRTDFSQAMVPAILEQSSHDVVAERERRSVFRRRYVPRLLIGRTPGRGLPKVREPDPSLQNLFGRIEYANEQGALTTDYHRIYPGALHQANGGYLVLEADKVVADPAVWDALKRCLKSGSIRFETPPAEQGAPAMATLSPKPIPLTVKIALVGSSELFYALRELDPEFPELFRVLAEFDRYFPRDPGSMMDFACLLKTLSERQGLAPLSSEAVASLLTYSARLAEHQQRLSARVGRVVEVAAEADLFRRRGGGALIGRSHVEEALAAREQRIGRIREELMAEILNGVVLIATEGHAAGRVNALTLLQIGDSVIGLPARITATVHVGGRGVVDIEREVELGQALHSKGVMILAGYLGHQFARRLPFAMSANIALEQSYGHVEGDSAALAELCALLSALTGIPLDQSFAVTGSLNQYGDVQAVGGINEKIEGFFELCRARGLTGRQGIVIPQANVCNLVLADPVVQAVREGRFAIHAVQTADQALEILTGQTPVSIRERATAELESFAKVARVLER